MKSLISPLHPYTAMAELVPIAVPSGEELIGTGKIVEATTQFSVKIGDHRFVREVRAFKYNLINNN